jgi:hypothetical protein
MAFFCPHVLVYWRRMDICLLVYRYALCQKLSEIRFFTGRERNLHPLLKSNNRTITAGSYVDETHGLTKDVADIAEDAVRMQSGE